MMPCGPVTGGLNKKPVPQNEQTKHWKGKLQNQNFQTSVKPFCVQNVCRQNVCFTGNSLRASEAAAE
jgi:hypothetical protein